MLAGGIEYPASSSQRTATSNQKLDSLIKFMCGMIPAIPVYGSI